LVRFRTAETVGAALAVGAAVTGVLIPAAAGAQTTSTGAVPAGVFNGTSSLAGIAASSPANAWAVGSTAVKELPDGLDEQRCVIAHWNGRRWRTNERCPSPGRDSLAGVTALSTRSAWAVGATPAPLPVPGSPLPQPLILRWNGIRWRRVPTPTFKSGAQLAGVAAVSPRSAWAVGSGPDGSPLILHWNGHRWTKAQLPALPFCDGSCGGLTGVAATSSSNAWAVGSEPADSPLILHWNGHRWTDAQLPALPFCDGNFCNLTGVAATSSSNAWVVGVNLIPSEVESTSEPFILHWNGRAWKNVPCPVCTNFDGLSGLNAVTTSRGLAWAVGYAQPMSPTGPAGPGHVVILRWNGHVWKQMRVSSPSADTDPVLNGVAAPSGKLAWAVGGPYGGSPPTVGVSSAFLFTWNGKVWR
jgi:hypothetical protein